MKEQGLIDQMEGSNADTKGGVSPAMEEKGLIDGKEGSNADINGEFTRLLDREFTRLENLTHANDSEQDQRRKQRQREILRQCKSAAPFRGKPKCYTIKQV
ncbi:uncharacterized protein LOC131047784 isoform X2 [Cryptomeria japonica]|uniref:uncharacterized protein LOC131047784 isoform X2 n=1 Tax=Cryptomeria japonica TaxID=3369 RepID=UPI0025ABCB8A|nr:uncharacterized protein LOC131047784 isoform X2 [Cryptomeria japonica]XP_059065589.1 uncharacterized protein LOC131047784 isoform X2 [Cryptomeria japonica]XP_059065590.1 uncharacterized protein LOC131047784 isoform X2 [Cryptomeria japonica]